MSTNKPYIQDRDEDHVSLIASSLPQANKEFDKSDILVLVIDDNSNLLYSTKSIIEANDYQCIIADGGEAGLGVLHKMPIDIVLLDLAMPDIDGGLIGGASLQAEEFLRICAAAKA